ncbi:unnamed protein product [Merluccius merluccius]
MVNYDKSSLTPIQTAVFLGIDSWQISASPSLRQVDDMLRLLGLLQLHPLQAFSGLPEGPGWIRYPPEGYLIHPVSAVSRTAPLMGLPSPGKLRAIYLPGLQNDVADFLPCQEPPSGEWRLHPEVVGRIWHKVAEPESFVSLSGALT